MNGKTTTSATSMGEVRLRNGEYMKVKLVTPPATEDVVEELTHFIDHKPDNIVLKIRRQLRGDFSSMCVDKFFVGEINGQLAGHLWYGYGKDGAGIANFGEVYTSPNHRGKGVVKALMKYFVDDFNASPARAALCTCGSEWIVNIYKKFGFQTVIEGASVGPLILIKDGKNRSFDDFATSYYQPIQPVSVENGDMRYRHDIDTLLRFTNIMRHGATIEKRLERIYSPGSTLAGRVGSCWHIANYMEASFLADEGHGHVAVAVLPDNKVVGWAFALSGKAPNECRSFDYEIHPDYAASAPVLVGETLRRASELEAEPIFAWLPSTALEKISVLESKGFGIVGRIPDYFHSGKQRNDLIIMCI